MLGFGNGSLAKASHRPIRNDPDDHQQHKNYRDCPFMQDGADPKNDGIRPAEGKGARYWL